jgi:hypothetical protein
MKTTWAALFLIGAIASPALADRADDDLAVVRKAVGGGSVARAGDARWFRVRIVEKAGKRGKVSVNLPLALVRAVGEDWPIHDCRKGGGKATTFGEVLRSLDAGQSLVEIEDDEATVRVWVD